MFGTRMTDVQVTTLVAELKKMGLCKSKQPKRAMLEATDRRMTCRKARTWRGSINNGPWVVESNADALAVAQEKDLPVICLVTKIAPVVTKAALTRHRIKSDDGLLDVIYDITNRGKATKVGVAPYDTDAVMEAILAQPTEVLIKYMGTHPMLDAYINHRLAGKE
jgi:hypothetical protein